MAGAPLPTSRLGRLARLAALGTRAGAGRIASALGSEGSEAAVAEIAAEALGTMRGLALKLGQMASYVDGFVPEQHRDLYEDTMKKLRDAAPAMAPDAAARVLRAELGDAPEQLFASWEQVPFASASIGQVHRATLADGREVAVKVQYEGIDRAVAADLSNASMMTGLLGPIGTKFAAKDQIAEMRARFTEELDYRHEASRQTIFGDIFAGHARVRIPKVVSERSGKRVLTTELARGKRLEEACERSPAERAAWAETLWTFVFESLLVHGLFNADPHPGNYLFVDVDGAPGGTIWFLDFGCTRALRPEKLRLVREAHRAAAIDHDERAFEEAFADMIELPRRGEQWRRGRLYMHRCFEPILARGPYRITRDYARGLFEEMQENARIMLLGSRKEFSPLPAEWLFFNRLQLGFYSVLARLDVEVDYGILERRILEAALGRP